MRKYLDSEKLHNSIWKYGLVILMIAGCALRLYALGSIPYGLNQDEASIGYEAFSLAMYGTDRYGHPWPVYPITWGSGGGSPLMIYLSVCTTKLFGVSVWSLRLIPAVLGCATLVLFCLLALRLFGKRAAFFAALLIAVNPWHLMLSRWSLDCNTLPFWLLAASYALIKGMQSEPGKVQTVWYLSSAALYAVCVYAYGSATVVIPLTLAILAFVSIKKGRIQTRQMLAAMAVFVIVLLPIGVFYSINYLGLPDLETTFFSVTKFTGTKSVFYERDAALPAHMWESARYLLRFLTIGSKDTEIICSQVPGVGTMYRFSFPLTWAGFYIAVRAVRTKSEETAAGADMVMMVLFAVSFIFSLFLELNISRMTMFLVPMLYFQLRGWRAIAGRWHVVGWLVALVFCIGGSLFLKDYFGERYRRLSAESFMPGYGEAVLYAETLSQAEGTIYSTYRHVAAPYMVAMYYLQTPPAEFMKTVQWREEGAEFMIADAFGNLVFGLPEDILSNHHDNDVLILHREDLDAYHIAEEETAEFGDFMVVKVR